jgi:4-hydroxy-tetrahydrodipicolinate synthase
MKSPLGTILTAMVTPFGANGKIDYDEARRLAVWLVDRGNDGLVVAGSTGEGQTLDAKERNALVRAVKEAVGKRAQIVANAGSNDTRDSVRAVKEAQEAGADAILAVVPYYNKPPQSGMLAHFSAIADATPLPVVVYNIPGRTGANMMPETLLELARRKRNIAGVKESSGDLRQIGMILRERAPGFTLWAGDDHLFLPILSLGGDGVVGVASHLCSLEYRRMVEAFFGGEVETAAQIHASVLPLVDALFAYTSPIPIKWAMGQIGFHVGPCRLPLDAMPAALAERLRPLLIPYLSTPVSS